MLHNLPREFSREDLVSLLASKGCLVLARFLYLPLDSASGQCLGYAFLALCNAGAAERTRALLDGLTLSAKALRATWNTPCQGLEEQVQRFRNSPLMHPSVPDAMKPILLSEGFRVAFPSPTRTLRAPRTRDRERLRAQCRRANSSEATP